MGFDIIGMNAKNKKGEYFINNCWWWRPLAMYVLDNCDIPEKEQNAWAWNNGEEISEETALSIAKKLKALIKSGATKKYEKEYKAKIKKLPLVECEFCKGTGERDDEYVKGKCNCCEGKGKKKEWATAYPFSTANVKEFAEFCESSGGFQIC